MKDRNLKECRASPNARHTRKKSSLNVWKNRLYTLTVVMFAATMSVCVSQGKDSHGALDNTSGDGVGSVLDAPLPVNGGWAVFTWSGGVGSFNNEGAFTFSTPVPVYVSVTDAYAYGDRFEVFDNGVSLGMTSEPIDDGAYGGFSPDCAYMDTGFSSGQFLLGAGEHAITLKLVQAGAGYTYGSGYLRADTSAFAPETVAPANDDFNDAMVVSAQPFKHIVNTVSATRAADDPTLFCPGYIYDGATVWYAFTAPSNMRMRAHTRASDYDTVLSVYTGARGALSRVTCNDDICNDAFCYVPQSEVTFTAAAGGTYFLAVGSWSDDCGGNLVLDITGTVLVTPPGPCPDLTGSWSAVSQTCKTKQGTPSCKITGTLVVRNVGTLDAPTSFVRYYLSSDREFDAQDLFLKQVATGTIKLTKPKNRKLSAKLPVGVSGSGQFLIAVIDADRTIAECNENNNIIVFGPLP